LEYPVVQYLTANQIIRPSFGGFVYIHNYVYILVGTSLCLSFI